YHFTDRLARVRPYVLGGFGMNTYYPTREAKAEANAFGFSGLDTSIKPALNFGGGVKVRLNKSGWAGLRFDVRGILSDNPQFKVVPAADKKLWGVQPTVGLNVWFGRKHQDREFERTVTVTAAAPPPAPVTRNSITATNIQGGGDVCG